MKKEKVIKVKLQKDYELVKPRKERNRLYEILRKKMLTYVDYLYLERNNYLMYIRHFEHVTLAKIGSTYFLTLFYENEEDDEDEYREWYSTQNLGKIPESVALRIFKETKAEYR